MNRTVWYNTGQKRFFLLLTISLFAFAWEKWKKPHMSENLNWFFGYLAPIIQYLYKKIGCVNDELEMIWKEILVDANIAFAQITSKTKKDRCKNRL
jgi:hypothetical protein